MADVVQCWSCGHQFEVPPHVEDGTRIQCECGETCVVQVASNGVLPRTMSVDEDYESRCDSEASARYEEAAYGRPDGD